MLETASCRKLLIEFRSSKSRMTVMTVESLRECTPPFNVYFWWAGELSSGVETNVICVAANVLASIVSLKVNVKVPSVRSSSKDTKLGSVMSAMNPTVILP